MMIDTLVLSLKRLFQAGKVDKNKLDELVRKRRITADERRLIMAREAPENQN